jgi:small-conductance mechanosensitive channel
VFEATLFLLVAHAYDVGDMLDIDGTPYRVCKISLLYTVGCWETLSIYIHF